jgi:hypothetical protein
VVLLRRKKSRERERERRDEIDVVDFQKSFKIQSDAFCITGINVRRRHVFIITLTDCFERMKFKKSFEQLCAKENDIGAK